MQDLLIYYYVYRSRLDMAKTELLVKSNLLDKSNSKQVQVLNKTYHEYLNLYNGTTKQAPTEKTAAQLNNELLDLNALLKSQSKKKKLK